MFISVRRQPQDHNSATYKLDGIYDLKWDNVGCKSAGYPPFNDYYICGYVYCNEAVDGAVSHSCRHGNAPHYIKVCVIRKDTDKAAYKELLEIVGEKPKRESKKKKR